MAGERLDLLAPGVEGELLIGGPGVAKGYLRRDRLTREKFISNPFWMTRPIRFCTGPAMRWRSTANGEIVFRGRIDDQVKVRGFRVELGEIEAKLAGLPGVAHAAVVLRNDNEIEQLVAFVVPSLDAEIDARLLRNELRQSLPAYMVPERFEIVESLPKLASGKIDRKSLKQIELAAADAVEAQEEPRNETEAKLLDAAKRVLPPQAIPFDADFFTDLGGHSLARGALHLDRARNARVGADHLARRLHRAFAARDGRTPRPQMGIWIQGRGSVLRAAAFVAPLPLRVCAGRLRFRSYSRS